MTVFKQVTLLAQKADLIGKGLAVAQRRPAVKTLSEHIFSLREIWSECWHPCTIIGDWSSFESIEWNIKSFTRFRCRNRMNGQIPFNFVLKIDSDWLINPLVMTFCVSPGSNLGHCAGNCSRMYLTHGNWSGSVHRQLSWEIVFLSPLQKQQPLGNSWRMQLACYLDKTNEKAFHTIQIVLFEMRSDELWIWYRTLHHISVNGWGQEYNARIIVTHLLFLIEKWGRILPSSLRPSRWRPIRKRPERT
jgi:hypothetical protein